jgi:hypothetical protein
MENLDRLCDGLKRTIATSPTADADFVVAYVEESSGDILICGHGRGADVLRGMMGMTRHGKDMKQKIETQERAENN